MPNIYTYVKINVHDGASANIRKLKFEYLQLHICVYVCSCSLMCMGMYSHSDIQQRIHIAQCLPHEIQQRLWQIAGIACWYVCQPLGQVSCQPASQCASEPVRAYNCATLYACRGAQCWVCGLSTTTLTTSGRNLQLIVWQINLKQEPHLTTI